MRHYVIGEARPATESLDEEQAAAGAVPLSNDPAAVLAVKGPLRRFAPLTAPGHREKAT
jgi:hypothetical protein